MTRFIDILTSQKATDRPAFWFMRQAGRYLPEYLEVRASCDGFLNLCYTPDKATEVTLQPIRRFDMDAAIIFSDILVIPHAMGMDVSFVKGEGPKLTPLTSQQDIEKLHTDETAICTHLQPVYNALRQTRTALPQDKALIGFAGAPWTLACYMLQGRGGNEFITAREYLYQNPQQASALIDRITDAVIIHLRAQIDAGADALQLFDSWAGLTPAPYLQACVIDPAIRIVAALRESHPQIPVIAFPRGIGAALGEYARQVKPAGISIDTNTPLATAAKAVEGLCAIQGNLDPLLLAADGDKAAAYVKEQMQMMKGVPYIVNLGHGIVPHTPIEHVERVCETIKSFQ